VCEGAIFELVTEADVISNLNKLRSTTLPSPQPGRCHRAP
jgi:hypothetical protein